MEIRHTNEQLPDEEDVYGVNEINEYDADYWMPDQLKRFRRAMLLRVVAAVLALAFITAAVYMRWF
ncbi:MAG: hypothetical protein IT209_12085 [Armatimonadetes bacterium]|nr:hypothetical protein [Armatimonadota bacterium]